jgi:hypothetical protein
VIADHLLDAAEQFLVLQFLVTEAHQCLQCRLVAEPVIAAHFQHLGVDESLDQTEHVRIGATLYLADQAFVIRVEKIERTQSGDTVGQEFPGKVELPSPDDIPVDVPAHTP